MCNGFQVLTEAHLLPGALLRNTHMRFVCDRVRVRVETVNTPWTAGCDPGEELTLPVAHNEGNYFADPETLARVGGRRTRRTALPGEPERVGERHRRRLQRGAATSSASCRIPRGFRDPALGSDEGLEDTELRARGGWRLNIQETYSSLGLSDFEYDRILELMGTGAELSWSSRCSP